ncbi:MAG TPA: ABC transporter permease [Dehalococcoidia bacterium]|nr:ABC transporter permease [Dehalococcoidia bacterium]HIA17748.1 ABC transporter permease [Dehalococcoidia bacterium]HIN72772.1 ABC transporter permease [Dehalococcoidia bacterium]
MRAYILRRLALFVPTAFGVSVFIFLMLHVIPGDYATSVLLRGRDRTIIATQADFDRIREQLGLDGSLPRQYIRWAGNFVQGDFGESWTNKRPVIDRMAPRIALSAELAFLSIVLAMIIAIPGGIIAAVKQDTWIDYTLRTLSMGFDSAPNFWLALLLIVGLLWAFDWIPPISYRTPWENPWQNFQILIFPALIIGARSSAGMLRMTRSSVLEVLREDYVRTANAKGLARPNVLFIHVLRNAMLPVITLAGFEVVILMGGLVVIEQVFNLPGIGKLLIQGVAARDYPVIQAIIMFVAGIVLVANLVVDVLYSWFDPRIRYT